LSPKETPFEFENVNADARLLVVPAETLMAEIPPPPTDAVIVPALRPNETPFELLKVTAFSPAVDAPADTVTAHEAVSSPLLAPRLLKPNETPFELLTFNVPRNRS
jgi:hypothetical protein